MIKTLIVDDLSLSFIGVQAVLKKALGRQAKIQVASSIQVFDGLVGNFKPDLVILGLRKVPVMNRAYIKEKIFQAYPTVPIIIYYDHFVLKSIIPFSRQGAVGFISTNMVPDELHDCIRNVLKQQTYLCEETSQKLLEALLAKRGRHKITT